MGKKSEKPAVSTTTSGIDPRFQPFLDDLVKGASGAFGRNKKAPTPDFSPAGFNDTQNTAQNRILQTTGAGGPLQSFIDTILGTASTNLTDFLKPDNPTVQNAVDAAVQPVIQNFNESILPSIRGEAQLTGNTGSSREGIAQSRAIDALLQNVSNTSASVTNQAFQTGLGVLTDTLALSPDLTSNALFPSLSSNAVGEQRQQQDQRLLDADVQTQLFNNDKENTALANFANILFGIPGGQSTGTQQAAQGASNGFGSALSGASLGFKIGGPWGAAVGGGLGLLSSIF